MSPSPSESPPPAPAGLGRRLAALVYDGLLLAGVLFFAAIPAVVLAGGEAVPLGHPAFRAYLVAVVWFYFAFQWTRGGQTLGMKTWRIQLVSAAGAVVTWRQSVTRFALALVSLAALGAGFLWALGDPERRTWHDRAAGTRVVRLG